MSISEARKAKGWSQSELARKLGLKSKSYICDIERGEPPSLKVAIGLFREFGIRSARIEDLTDREISILEKTLS